MITYHVSLDGLSWTGCAGPHGTGHLGAWAVASDETAETVQTIFQAVKRALPCCRPDCKHDTVVQRFTDGNGGVLERPCGAANVFRPAVRHDKAGQFLTASSIMKWLSLLCTFHAITAVRDWVMEKPRLRLFFPVILMCFKVSAQFLSIVFSNFS